MKVRVNQLEPNPYRNIAKYPISREKVEGLKISITETDFWDNVLARQHPENSGKFQIAYGHHRLIALQELDIEEVDIPIKNISDANMIRIMANENKADWKTNPAVVHETVLAVRNYLDAELAKYDNWEDGHVDKSINMMFDTNSQFQNCKKNGVGRTVILKFLGGNWKPWEIQEALESLKLIDEGLLAEEVVTKAPSLEVLRNFKSNIKKTPISKEKQVSYINEIVDEKTSKREVDNFFDAKEYQEFKKPQKKSERKSDQIIKYESYVAGIRNKADDLFEELKQLVRTEKELGEMSDNIYRKLLMMSLDTLSKQIELIIKNKENETTEFGNANLKGIA